MTSGLLIEDLQLCEKEFISIVMSLAGNLCVEFLSGIIVYDG